MTQQPESFRDRIGTVDEKGKRVWIFPKKPKGIFYTTRTITSIIQLAILVGLPFIKVDGHPFMLFNIIERKFIIFGQPFWPQDFHLFAITIITLFVSIILFTAVFGRIFCGWLCPQTIFMEMVFRKIEYLIDGDANRQRALASSPWTLNKFIRRAAKVIIFLIISFFIGNLLLAYIIGVDALSQIVTQPPTENPGGFTFVMLVTTIVYFVFSWFREQACLIVCPYGRLQSVLLDKDSIIVAYDFRRGEPRGRRKKGEDDSQLGDCIDCGMCVRVCPTGIDIRDGIQMECVNCTACIDACNEIMPKVNKPKDLIRYASHNGIEQGRKFHITARGIFYTIILCGLLTLLTFLLATRSDVETTILRTPGVLYQRTEDGMIYNLYSVKVVNKTFNEIPVTFKLESHEGRIQMVGGDLRVPNQDITEGALFIYLPEDKVDEPKERLTIGVYQGDELLQKVKTNFLGPM